MGNWSKLKADEKVRVIKFARQNGVSDIKTIRDTYNLYSNGGQEEILNKVNSSNANFVQRLKDPNRKNIPDWESPTDRISTHKLSVGTDENGNHYIFPEVQEINGELIDFTRPPYHRFAGEISAEMRGDTVRVPSIEDAIKFTETYKQYYPALNKKSTGGSLYPFSFEKNIFLKTPVVRYDEGGFFARLFGKKDTPPTPEEIKAARVERFINDTWETEYSVPKGYDSTTGLFYPYKSPEGGTKTIGPGFKLRKDGSGDNTMFSAKEAAKGVTREQINEKLRVQGELQYDKVLEFLNQKGNRLPVDTINPNIMNGLMDLRFQVGALGGWNNLREAVLNGDLEGIKKESKVTFEDEKTGKTKVDTRRNELRAEKFWHYD